MHFYGHKGDKSWMQFKNFQNQSDIYIQTIMQDFGFKPKIFPGSYWYYQWIMFI